MPTSFVWEITMDIAGLSGVALLFALVCAKWSMDLGFSQTRQLLWGIGGLFCGPIVALILYTRLIYRARETGAAGGQW
ncbi:MAG: hypothetical protein CMJ48_02340 [Planctomycetaceae bacterium]|nr:hypothetical protein [Planctomycetaceae bacterium]